MPYGTPTDPVAGTVITVAYAVTNLLDPIRALRANTGASDPPAANRVVVASGVGGPSAWIQIPTDAIADGAITDAKLLPAKVNRAGDTITGDLTVNRSGSANPTAGFLILGNDTAKYVGFDGTKHTIRGPTGQVDFLSGAITAISAALAGLVSASRFSASVATGTAPYAASSTTLNANLNADLVDGMHAADIIAAASAGGVPTGVGAYWTGSAASIPAGWARHTSANGRLLVGDGTTFSQPFVVNTPYGASWGHGHTVANHHHDMNHTHGVTDHNHGGSASGGTQQTGDQSNAGLRGSSGAQTNTADAPHHHDYTPSVTISTQSGLGTNSISGSGNTADNTSTADSFTWLPPMWGVIWIVKS